MNLELNGKCVVVTAASKGIGRAIALRFAEEGSNIAICARGEPQLRATEQELSKHGTKVRAVVCDVGQHDALDGFLETVHETFGRVDILINNATGFGMTDDEVGWRSSFDVDVMAAVRAARKVIPWMTTSGGGAIVHVASIAGLEGGWPGAYAAAKAALISHSKTLSLSLAGQKIRVNVVAPGSIEFPGGVWDMAKETNPALYEAVKATIPWGRMGTAEEVADAVAYLASCRASWITGECLVVDGGQHKGNL